MIEVDPIRPTADVEGYHCECGAQCRLEILPQLIQSPATGCEIANLDKAIFVLESDDGSIGAMIAPVVHG